MDRQEVASSQIRSIGWDEINRVLEVEFKGGSVYQYDGLTAAEHEIFMNSESKGMFFGKNIKPFPEKYPFRKVRGTDREEAKKEAQLEGEASAYEDYRRA